MGRDLGAETQGEAALGQGIQVVAKVGQQHRIAGEGDGDPGGQAEPLGVLGGEGQRDERIMGGLGRGAVVIAQVLQPLGRGASLETRWNPSRYLHDALHPAVWSALLAATLDGPGAA